MDRFQDFFHQVAGHDGTLIDTSGLIFAKLAYQSEIDFYTRLQYSSPESKICNLDSLNSHDGDYDKYDEYGSRLKDWVPVFMGTLTPYAYSAPNNEGKDKDEITQLIEKTSNAVRCGGGSDAKQPTYIILNNLLYGYNYPSVIDIKLGSVLTDPLDPKISQKKHERLALVSKNTTSGSNSFRICGLRLFNDDDKIDLDMLNSTYSNRDGNRDDSFVKEEHIIKQSYNNKSYLKLNKGFGKSLKADNIKQALSLFFLSNSLSPIRKKKILENTLNRLKLFYNCLLDEEIRIFSCSLLIAYENDREKWDALNDHEVLLRDYPFGSSSEYDDDEDDGDDEDDEEEEAEEEKEKVEYRRKYVENDDFNGGTSVDNPPLSSLNLIDLAHARSVPNQGRDENIVEGVYNLMEILKAIYNSL
ncbi:inositol polyphosphate multikinase [Ascoidea rubescens DSM 1968]|uniref:Kinase n=1 Tax=Ascoidea rubescens DSM 1968 TaxID=1344418 RepID=A0A1D2VB71_9ASCO|nr:SAICAR synthase-like protein [Ascoidea rubescens DSM 1968]ODV58850.1 SAICAR synthase-like protein [Ascoidea rubescens DSM 1968]